MVTTNSLSTNLHASPYVWSEVALRCCGVFIKVCIQITNLLIKPVATQQGVMVLN